MTVAAKSDAADAERRRPQQRRSRERVDRILGSAAGLITARGGEQVKMSEIAADSGMSLGALYQYFPDKAAIVRTLAEQYNSAARACIDEALAPVRTLPQLQSAFGDLVRQYLGIARSEPPMRAIWSSMQTDARLAEIQAAESRACAALLEQAVRRARPDADGPALALTSLLVWELGEAMVRLAVTVDEAEGNDMADAYIRMMLGELAGRRGPAE